MVCLYARMDTAYRIYEYIFIQLCSYGWLLWCARLSTYVRKNIDWCLGNHIMPDNIEVKYEERIDCEDIDMPWIHFYWNNIENNFVDIQISNRNQFNSSNLFIILPSRRDNFLFIQSCTIGKPNQCINFSPNELRYATRIKSMRPTFKIHSHAIEYSQKCPHTRTQTDIRVVGTILATWNTLKPTIHISPTAVRNGFMMNWAFAMLHTRMCRSVRFLLNTTGNVCMMR